MIQNQDIPNPSYGKKTRFRYSVAEKKVVIKQFEEGVTQKALSHRYGVSVLTIQDWVNKFASAEYRAARPQLHDWNQALAVVRAIREGRLTVKEASLQQRVSVHTVRVWLRKSKAQEAEDVPAEVVTASPDSIETDKERQLRKELEAAQWKIRALETMIEVAETELKIPIRKKPGAKQ